MEQQLGTRSKLNYSMSDGPGEASEAERCSMDGTVLKVTTRIQIFVWILSLQQARANGTRSEALSVTSGWFQDSTVRVAQTHENLTQFKVRTATLES